MVSGCSDRVRGVRGVGDVEGVCWYGWLMQSEQEKLRGQIGQATERLLKTLGGFTDGDVRVASLLPGWTRGHVLTHIARSADALRILLHGAQSGVPASGYSSQEARNYDIELGADRTMAALIEDVVRSDENLWSQAAGLSEEAWQRSVKILHYQPFPASQVLLRRWVEIELHHVDLGAGYQTADWPTEFSQLELPEPMRSQRATR